ncbi:MAG: tetratricopeptide repeat protein [Planctomycetota bacterium]
MRRWIGAVVGLCVALCARGQSFDSADELLDAVETADARIERLTADLAYVRDFALVGDRQLRVGSLAFVNETDSRRFAVLFETLIVGDRREPDGRTFVFDGEWLTERIPSERLMLRRQVAPPGAKFDPLRVGEGPLPLPLGQKKADILSSYTVAMPEPAEGLAGREDQSELEDFIAAKKASQLKLTPRPERIEDDPFDEIRLWYARHETGVLPVMAMTLNKTGDEVVVRLINVRLNADASIDESVFDDEPPVGWDVDETPYRGAAAEPGITAPVFARLQPELDPRLPPQPADNTEAADRFTLPAAVRRVLEAGYTSEDDAAGLRVFHGAWTAEDLKNPLLAAEAALMRGDLDHASLQDAAAPATLRAAAMIGRGELQDALGLLEGNTGFRAVRLRVGALERLGRHADALAATGPAIERLTNERVDDAAELTDAVAVLIARARLGGPERADGTDFQTLMTLLTRASGEIDRLYWPAFLLEAQLLYDKDERGRASEALQQVLRLNPASAEAWALLGRLAVDGFDFDRAEAIAARLDALAEHELPWWTGEGSPVPEADEPSVLGGIVIARARVRQDEPDSGLELVQRLLERHPRQRDLLAAEAALHACRYDLDSARATLDELDGFSPGTEAGYLLAGWALSERRQYAESAELLETAVARQPNRPEAAILLGLLELQSGRDLNALSALRRVAELDPFNARAANSLELLEELVTYETVESEHFVIRYKPGIDEILARMMPPVLERIHERVTGAANGGIDHEPAQKTIIELMPNHAWFAVRIAGMPQIHTIAAATGPVIAMEAPKIGPGHKVGVYDWARTLQHEYVHTVTLSRTKNRLPHWFTEAAAQYLEDAPRDEGTCRLLVGKLLAGELFDMDEINIRFTRPRTPEDRSLAYAQGHWMYQYMVETFGDAAPRELMDAYARGEREAQAMPSVLGVDRDAFREGFEEWAHDQAESWGLIPPEGTLTVQMLAARDGVHRQPTVQQIETWLEEFPDQAGLIELLVSKKLDGSRTPTPDLVPVLERWAELVPVAERPHRLLSRYYLDSEHPERAMPHLEFLDARAQYTPAFASALATRYAEQRRLEEAERKAMRAVTIAPFDADHRELAARVALLRQDLAGAERHLDALTKIEPDRPRHAERLARVRELMTR